MADETNVQSTESTTATEQEKTFTQADVDTLIEKRLARERKKYPSEDEMKSFRDWKESQQTEKDRWDALTKERDTARTDLASVQSELEQLKREKILVSKGVPAEDVDYYAFKIGKLVTENITFEKAAEEFLKENNPARVRVDMTAQVGSGKLTAKTGNEAMNALIRGAFK